MTGKRPSVLHIPSLNWISDDLVIGTMGSTRCDLWLHDKDSKRPGHHFMLSTGL